MRQKASRFKRRNIRIWPPGFALAIYQNCSVFIVGIRCMMVRAMSGFISWSGKRSKDIALELRRWLPNVLQAADVWMSDVDIEVGMRGIHEIFTHLEKAKVGIICLTPENSNAPWLLFEAGALSKQVVEKSRVCPYLFGA
jgi:TIR domain